MQSIYIPYTYLIGWSSLKVFYYGVRYAKNCNPSDLWVTYFTSSKYVAAFREIHGEPDIIQIRKQFPDNKARAILWEDNVIMKLRLHRRFDFLNKNRSRGFDLDYATICKNNRAPDRCKAVSNGLTGLPKTAEHKLALSKVVHPRGWTHRENTKNLMSTKALAYNPGFTCQHTCPLCSKQGQKANIVRHHGLHGEKCRWY